MRKAPRNHEDRAENGAAADDTKSDVAAAREAVKTAREALKEAREKAKDARKNKRPGHGRH